MTQRRRYLQYSLRSFLLLTVLAAICLAWLRNVRHRRDQSRQLESLGARVELEPATGKLVEALPQEYASWFDRMIMIDFSRRTNESLADLMPLAANQIFVRDLRLVSCFEFGDDQFAQLRRLRVLRTLHLDSTAVTDESMKQVGGLRQLTTLSLYMTRVTNDGVARLVHLRHLENLDLGGTDVDDGCVPNLLQLRALQRIDLSQTKFTDSGLAKLRNESNAKIICRDTVP